MRWTLQALPATIMLTACSPSLVDPKFLVRYAPLKQLCKSNAEQVLSHGTARSRFILAADPASPLSAQIPFDRYFELRAKFAIRLWRVLRKGPPGDNPAALTEQHCDRLVLQLRALDGKDEGASITEIAAVLFGKPAMSSSGWKTHHVRSRTRDTIKAARKLSDGGYRRLLLWPYRRHVPRSLLTG